LKQRLKAKKKSPGQKSLWDEWNIPFEEIEGVAKTFVLANCLNPDIAATQFTDTT
jgi:putative transposase